MSSSLGGFVLIVLTFLVSTGQAFRCPERDQTVPCLCTSWDDPTVESEVEILCEGHLVTEDTLRSAFKSLATFVRTSNQSLAFDSLRLVNSGLTSLDSNLFDEITFKTVDLFSNANLTRLRPAAFGGSSDTLRTLSVQNSPLGSNNGSLELLFSDIRTFPKLESLSLNDNGLTFVPANAFNTPSGQGDLLPNLTLIDLSNNELESIGSRAFRALPRLTRLILDNNKIKLIANESFSIKTIDISVSDEDDKQLLLFLRNNGLTAESFESGSMSFIGRDFVTIYLSSNKLSYVPEAVFKPLFGKTDSLVAVWHNPFICDCKVSWLLSNTIKYQRRVHGVICPDDREIWDYAPEQLTACSN